MHRFLEEHGRRWPPMPAAELRRAMDRAMPRPAAQALPAWWAPRLERIADWVAETEAERRAVRAPAAIVAEVRGGGSPARRRPFRLAGRADRIER